MCWHAGWGGGGVHCIPGAIPEAPALKARDRSPCTETGEPESPALSYLGMGGGWVIGVSPYGTCSRFAFHGCLLHNLPQSLLFSPPPHPSLLFLGIPSSGHHVGCKMGLHEGKWYLLPSQFLPHHQQLHSAVDFALTEGTELWIAYVLTPFLKAFWMF